MVAWTVHNCCCKHRHKGITLPEECGLAFPSNPLITSHLYVLELIHQHPKTAIWAKNLIWVVKACVCVNVSIALVHMQDWSPGIEACVFVQAILDAFNNPLARASLMLPSPQTAQPYDQAVAKLLVQKLNLNPREHSDPFVASTSVCSCGRGHLICMSLVHYDWIVLSGLTLLEDLYSEVLLWQQANASVLLSLPCNLWLRYSTCLKVSQESLLPHGWVLCSYPFEDACDRKASCAMQETQCMMWMS